MTSGSGMSLRLRNLFNMEQDGCMCFPRDAQSFLEGLAHSGIIPSFYFINVDTVSAFLLLHACESIGDGRLGSLIFLRNRNSVAIIPNKYCKRNLHHSGCVDGLPEMTLTRRCITNRAEANLVSVLR